MIGKFFRQSLFSVFLFSFFLLFLSRGITQEVSVDLKLGKSRIYYGESVDLELTLSNADDTAEVNISSLNKDFQVDFVRGKNLHQESISIINGRMTKVEFRGHSFLYLLTPLRGGEFVVGPISVDYKGNSYQSNRKSLEVVGAEETDQVFLEISTERSDYTIGEKFTVYLDIYLKRLAPPLRDLDPFFAKDPPSISIPWLKENSLPGLGKKSRSELLEPYLTNDKPGFYVNNLKFQGRQQFFSFFEDQKPDQFRFLIEEVQRKNKKFPVQDYFRYRFPISFQAKEVGSYTLGPVLFKGQVATKIISGRQVASRDLVTSSPELLLQVVEPPSVGRPATFTGGIGKFFFQSKIVPEEAYVGDPMTLTLEIIGEGLIENILPLKLEEQEKIAKNFKVYDETVNSETKSGQKTFTYTLRPLHDQVKELPSISFSYYDVESRSYKTLSSEKIPLTIKEVKTLQSSDMEGKKVLTSNISQLEEKKGGIFANHESLDGIERQTILWEGWEKVILWAFPASYFAVLPLVYYRRRQTNNLSLQKKKKAFSGAQKKLAQVDSSSNVYGQLNAILNQYIADKYDLFASGMVGGEIIDCLEGDNVDASLVKEIQDFLSQCEAAQYAASVSINESSPIDVLKGLINKLEKVIC